MKKLLILTSILAVSTVAHAQSQDTLQEVRIVGVPEAQVSTIKSRLPVYAGSKLSDVNVEAVKAALLRLGLYQVTEVTVQQQNGANVLLIQLQPNPRIASVTITGSNLVDQAAALQNLETQYGIVKGAQLNTTQLETARLRLRQALRELGLPFAPEVQTQVQNGTDGATLTFTIKAEAPVKQVVFRGLTRISQQDAQMAFADLVKAGTFTPEAYEQALAGLSATYRAAGYLGSGADVQNAVLNNGILTVPVVELTIGSIDASLISPAPTLLVKPGDPFRPADFTADLQKISQQLGKTVTLDYRQNPSSPSQVDVQLVVTEIPAGTIETVRFEGNTAVPAADLQAVLKSSTGTVFSLPLAQEDYLRLQQLYRERGLDILVPAEPLTFDGKTLTFQLQEVRLAGYDIKWEGEHRTDEAFVRSQLPDPGTVLNANSFRKALQTLVQGGVIKALNVQTVPSEDPSQVRLALTLQDTRSLNISPGLSYAPGEGWSGDLQISDTNLFGQGHQISASLNFTPSVVGQSLGGSVSYALPYLGTPEQPLSAKATLSSQVMPALAIRNNGTDVGRSYTQRTNQATIELGTNLSENVFLSGGVMGEISQSYLEPGNPDQPADSDPAVTQNLPGQGWSVQAFTTLGADYSNDARFATEGFRASLNASYGFGYEKTQLSWGKVQAGLRGYLNLTPGSTPQLILAGRVDAGTIVGTAPESALFRAGGSQYDDRLSIKGFDEASMTGSNFFTASVEARGDFGLKADFLQGLYAIAFVDAGDAWTHNDFNLNVGYGVGVQADVGTEGFVVPLRFDYAFSNLYPQGKFSFKLGFAF